MNFKQLWDTKHELTSEASIENISLIDFRQNPSTAETKERKQAPFT